MNSKAPHLFLYSLLILSGILLAYLYFLIIPTGSKDVKKETKAEQMLQTLDELGQLKTKLESVITLPAKSRNVEITLLKKDIENIEKQILNMKEVEAHRAKLVEENVRRADQVMSMTNLLIGVIIIIFGFFIAAVGQITFNRYSELKSDLDIKISDLAAIKSNVDKQKKRIDDQVKKSKEVTKKFNIDIQDQKKSISTAGNFVHILADEFFSPVIIEILSKLSRNKIIEKKVDKELRNRIEESRHIIFLKHPDKKERQRAIFELIARRAKRAINDLEIISRDESEDDDLRRLAVQAINEIKEREAAPES